MNIFKLKIRPNKEVFYNKDSSFGVYSCELQENLTPELKIHLHPIYETLTLTGTMPKLELYRTYTINCTEADSKYGKQYNFISVEIKKANTSDEQFDFLATILTPLQIVEIKKVYDMPVDEIIKNTFDYHKVKGIGRKLYPKIKKKVFDNYVYFQLLSELGKYGITYKQITKLYDKYLDANTAINAVKNNPYILMELPGVGFKKADHIALNMDIEKNDIKRIIACTEYLLDKDGELGHTWSDINNIQKGLCDYIGYEIFEDKSLYDYICNSKKFIIVDDYKITTAMVYNTELKIAERLIEIKDNNTELNIDVDEFLKQQENNQGFNYDEKQREVFYQILNSNIFVLTGAAGTGKSSVVNGLLNMFDNNDVSYVLMSPSAKAAKVLEHYTNREASTIHRALGWTPEGFIFNRYNKLEYDIVILDEISMVGIFLFHSVLEAIGENTKLILIGDYHQLPSLEKGSILYDILQNNSFANVQLTKVFRQAEKSGIINVATKIRHGESFVKSKENKTQYYGENKDTIFIPCDKDYTIKNIIKTYKYLLGKNCKDDDIIVLLPIRKNSFGTLEVNKLLQEINNPFNEDKNEIKHGFKKEIIFRENDKVIHIKNDYEAEWHKLEIIENEEVFIPITRTGIFNGDIGRVYRIENNDGDNCIYVDYGDKYIRYENGELENLEHAWALTTHKFQGSANKYVIVGLDSRHYYMAKRNWLYTAVTRSSRLLFMCCDPYIVNKAIKDNEVLEKRTFLKEFLNQNL